MPTPADMPARGIPPQTRAILAEFLAEHRGNGRGDIPLITVAVAACRWARYERRTDVDLADALKFLRERYAETARIRLVKGRPDGRRG